MIFLIQFHWINYANNIYGYISYDFISVGTIQ